MRHSSSTSSRLAARLQPACWAALLAVAVVALLIAGCSGNDDDSSSGSDAMAYTIGDPVQDSTVAALISIGDETDTLQAGQFRQQMMQRTRGRLSMMNEQQRQQLQRSLLTPLIDFRAQLHEAQERGLTVDTAEVRQIVSGRIQQARSQMGDSTLQAQLARSGITLTELRQRLQDNTRQQLMVRNLRRQFADEVEQPSDQEVADYRREQAREVRLQHIFFEVPPGASQAQRDSIRQQAQAVLDSAKGGTAFATLASRHSQGGLGGPNGSMGYQTRRQMARPFARTGQSPSNIPFVEAAFALADSGDVVEEPVRSRAGYHLLRKTGERSGQPADSAEARQQLMAERQQEAVQNAIEDLRQNVTLHLNPNLVTADMSQSAEDAQGEGAQGESTQGG